MFHEAVVIDNGSETHRAGLSGTDLPSVLFRVSRENLNNPGQNPKLKPVITRGIITNWDSMEKIWQRTFEEKLKMDPKNLPLLITESTVTDKQNREKIVQVLFEKFQCPAVYVATPAILSMYACGCTTGIVVDIGHGVSHTVPIYQGYALAKASQQSFCAGYDLTDYLMEILRERRYTFTKFEDRNIVQDIKEKLCYVAENFEDELLHSSSAEQDYKLPDGKIITVGNERFRCAESLFQPEFIRSASSGIHDVLYNSILNCDVDIRRDLFANIILTGGSTLFPGFVERIQKELMMLSPTNVAINVKAAHDGQSAAWIGGSILASLTSFQSMWISKKEYEESGQSIVHKKCY